MEFEVFPVPGPRLRFPPQRGSLGKLFDLKVAQILRLAHGMPESARVCVIFVDALHPRHLGRRRIEERRPINSV